MHSAWLHRKFAYPLANLLFVLLVFPVTTVLDRHSRLLAYLATTTLVAIYFTLSQATDTIVHVLHCSVAVATWLPNFVFLIMGAVLTGIRIRR
jgi:lipopolysaccharide export LptBFGC system permease protein LptF